MRFARWSLITLAALVLLVVGGAAGAAGEPGGPGPAAAQDPAATIEPQLLEALAERDEATFWVVLRQKADLRPAFAIRDRERRGQFVLDRLNERADRSQAGLRDLLTEARVDFTPFWIANTIMVTGDKALVEELAERPEVAEIRADRVYEIPEPAPGEDGASTNAVEWGVDRINAPDVWDTFGVRGEGIVVANIDTGVQFDHPALVEQYRGNRGGGDFDHNYNWFDPSEVCGSPSAEPCDNNGHGTHTMGTMVGDDGGDNQIGVAPGARWIAVKGCETTSCSFSALLASGEWILAPTDLNGENPQPALRPHVVNNSWGGDGSDTFYQDTVQAWVAAGIFPSFSNGNGGPTCGTVGAPASYPESFGVGAFDINDNIASFSSRGPAPASVGGEIKPQLAAPGVGVRSSVPGNGYGNFSGTSMAAPHLSGAVALMWAAAPALVGDLTSTRAILGETAIDTDDTTCAGTPENNNVWGEGRLDAFAAVDESPRGPTGTLEGTVTDSATGDTIVGARIDVSGEFDRITFTGDDGAYGLILPVGTYDVSAGAFGYLSETASGVGVNEDETTTQDFALDPAPAGTVSGTVSDDGGEPLAGATVTIRGTPIPPATTGADGSYRFDAVPEGTYEATADAEPCLDAQTQELVVSGETTLDFSLPRLSDDYGYFCHLVAPNYIEGDTPLGLSGDNNWTELALPFEFPFYADVYDTAFVSTNGYVNFHGGNSIFQNFSIPAPVRPYAAIYAFHDFLFVDAAASTWTALVGEAPDRQFVIEWRNVRLIPSDPPQRIDVEMVLHENGQILLQYRNIAGDGREQGNSATIGVEDPTGTVAHQYSFNEPAVGSPEFALLYQFPPNAVVGTVTDARNGDPIGRARVVATADGEVVRKTRTGGDGGYLMRLPLGSYVIEASATNYEAASEEVTLDTEGEFVTVDLALRPLAEVDPTALELVVPADETRTRTLTLSNTGELDLIWESRVSGPRLSGVERTNPSPTDAPWEDIADYPFGVQLHVADVWDDKLYSVAGFTDGFRTTDQTFAYDPATDTWTELSPIPTARHGHNGAIIDGRFYVVGGWDARGNREDNPPLPSLEIYDIATDTWTTGAPIPVAWGKSASVVLDGRLYLIGGCQFRCGSDDVWVYDPAADAWSEAAGYPFRTQSTHCGAIDGTIYCAGGWASGLDPTASGNAYDPAADEWSPIATMPTQAQFDGGYAAANGQLLVSGGIDIASQWTNVGFAYDPPTDTWSALPNANNSVASGASACGFYRIGGWGPPTFRGQAHSQVLPGFDECAEGDASWLDSEPTSGTLAPGASQEIEVTVDTTGMEPGVYRAFLHILSNSGRPLRLNVPIRLIIPAYQQGVNAAGSEYVDRAGDTWSTDQAYSAGDWGYTEAGEEIWTRRQIGETEDDPLYQRARRGPEIGDDGPEIGNFGYRFDDLPDGTYAVDLRFAEIQNFRPGLRIFDVQINGENVLTGYDISAEAGRFTADDHVFTVEVTGGTLEIEFLPRRGDDPPRALQPPIVNALRVTERPDQ